MKSLSLTLAALLTVATLAGCTQDPAQTTPVDPSATTAASDSQTLPPSPASDFECTATEDGGIMITKYIGTDTEVVIPESIDGKPVHVIGERTFDTKTKLTLVHMPDSVTKVEKWAFRNCALLKSVELSDRLTYIATEAFLNCYALEEIRLPATLDTLCYHAFVNCTSLTTVVFAEGMTHVGGPFAFTENCPKIKNVTIPASAQSVNPSTFVDLETVTFLGDAPLFGKDAPDGYSSPFISSNEVVSGADPEVIKEYMPTIYYNTAKSGWDTTEMRDYFHLVPIE